MKFTFILCTRNSERVLKEVIESIVFQKINNKSYEIIIADYESTDQTIEIVKNILTRYSIKFNYIKCLQPGKTPALEIALNSARGDYSVIVDDDNVLENNFIEEAEKLLIDTSWGCIGSQGIEDKNLFYPDWFKDYKGHYAIGFPLNAVDWVWGACCIINMTAWKKLKKKRFELQLNPIRINHSKPINLGGEDTELSLAIYMLGYKVQFIESLKFTHKFEQKRLNQKYLLDNVFGVCRSIPVLEIYRLVIYNTNYFFPKTFWMFVLFKKLFGCFVRMIINIFSSEIFKAKYNYKIIVGIISGFISFRKDFYVIFNRLIQIKKSISSLDHD